MEKGSCPVLSCPVLSCPVLSCPVLSCVVWSVYSCVCVCLCFGWVPLNENSDVQRHPSYLSLVSPLMELTGKKTSQPPRQVPILSPPKSGSPFLPGPLVATAFNCSRICFIFSIGFKGNRFHYGTYVDCFQGAQKANGRVGTLAPPLKTKQKQAPNLAPSSRSVP